MALSRFHLVLLALSLVHVPAPFAQSIDAKIQRHLQAAKEAERSRDYARAAEEYLKILKLRPQLAPAYQNLGLVYHLQSKYKDAIAAFEKAVALDPSLWGSFLFLGIDYYKTNQFSKAIPHLQKALAMNPMGAEAEARFWLGASYMALGRCEEAIEQFVKLAERSPKDIEILYNLAQAYRKLSSEMFDRISNVDPGSHRAHQLQAESYQSQNKLDEAIEEYKMALAIRPDLEDAHLALGDIYSQLGRLEDAAREYEEELKINPQSVEAWRRLSWIRQKLGLKQPAETQAGTEHMKDAPVSEADKNEKRTRLYLARSLLQTGQTDRAIRELKGILEGSSQDVDALYYLGKIYLQLADSTLRRMIDVDPNSYRVHQMIGENYERQEQYIKALEAYQAAYKSNPDLPGIRFAIGSVNWKMRRFDEAILWLKEELESNPHHSIANYQLGNIYLNRDDPQLAIRHLEEALRANPSFAEARRDLGKAFMQLGRYERAIEEFKMVAKAEPEDAAIHMLLSNAYRKLGRLEEARAELEAFKKLNEERLTRAQRKYAEETKK